MPLLDIKRRNEDYFWKVNPCLLVGVSWTHQWYWSGDLRLGSTIRVMIPRAKKQSMSLQTSCWNDAPQESFTGHMQDGIFISPCEPFNDIHNVIRNWADYCDDRCQWDPAGLTPREYNKYLIWGVIGNLRAGSNFVSSSAPSKSWANRVSAQGRTPGTAQENVRTPREGQVVRLMPHSALLRWLDQYKAQEQSYSSQCIRFFAVSRTTRWRCQSMLHRQLTEG